MTFFTIGQYFNRLYSAVLFLSMLPLLAFIAIYFLVTDLKSDLSDTGQAALFAAALLSSLSAVIAFNKKIKSVRNDQGLGAKLHKYFRITVVRFSLLSVSGMLLALGLYLSGNDLFALVYVAGLAGSAVLWPAAHKVCEDLRLKGDERKMVYFKKDEL